MRSNVPTIGGGGIRMDTLDDDDDVAPIRSLNAVNRISSRFRSDNSTNNNNDSDSFILDEQPFDVEPNNYSDNADSVDFVNGYDDDDEDDDDYDDDDDEYYDSNSNFDFDDDDDDYNGTWQNNGNIPAEETDYFEVVDINDDEFMPYRHLHAMNRFIRDGDDNNDEALSYYNYMNGHGVASERSITLTASDHNSMAYQSTRYKIPKVPHLRTGFIGRTVMLT